jgi:uncharacterized membrane protein
MLGWCAGAGLGLGANTRRVAEMTGEESNMAEQEYQIVGAVYPMEDGAKRTLDQLQQMKKDDIIHIVDAATMRKDAEGKVHTYQADIPHAKSAAVKGGVIGAVVGIIFPPSILAATALGAAAGAIGGKTMNLALKSDGVKQTANELEPGTSAVIAVIEDKWVDTMVQGLEGYSKLRTEGLDADAAAALDIQIGS